MNQQSLFAENRPIGTVFLVTAIEEFAKATLIIARFKNNISEKRFRLDFRSHNIKRAYASLFALIATAEAYGPKEAVKFMRLLIKLDFDAMRDASLYVDYQNRNFEATSEDLSNFARVLTLALRLKKSFAIMSDKHACAELLNEPYEPLGPKRPKSPRHKLIEKLMTIYKDIEEKV